MQWFGPHLVCKLSYLRSAVTRGKKLQCLQLSWCVCERSPHKIKSNLNALSEFCRQETMVLSSVRVCATAADMGKCHFRGVAPRSAKDSYPEEGKLRSLLTLESQQCQKTAINSERGQKTLIYLLLAILL